MYRIGMGFAAIGLLLAAVGISGCGSGSDTPFTLLSEGMVIGRVVFQKGDTSTGGQGQPVDGIACDALPATYHIHAHLSLFVNGSQIAIPEGIGIVSPGTEHNGFIDTGSCFYHLHTHDASGIIHVEAPQQADFTLGEFFDIWGETLSSSDVAGNQGAVQAFINGSPYTGDLRAIPLTPHELITLEVGTPTAIPPGYIFPAGY